MADNTTLNTGTGGDVIATDDVGGVKFQRVKPALGADGTAVDSIAVSNGLDSTGAGIPANGIVGQFDDAATSTVTENQFAPIRISSRRAQLVEGVASGTPVSVNSEVVSGSGSLTGSGQAVTLTLTGQANATFHLTGTWTATVTFEASNDGFTSSTTIYALRAGDNTISQTVVNDTNNDIYRCTTAGFAAVRARCSAYTSGTISIQARASANASGVFLNFPIPAGTNAIGTVTAANTAGDIAHDAGDSGNPVKVGFRATSALPTAVASADRANGVSDLFGRQLVGHIDGAMQVWKSAAYTTTQTGTTIWDPTSGKKIAITSIVVGSYGTTTGRLILWFGANGDTTYSAGTDQLVMAASYAPSANAKPGTVLTPAVPIYCTTADHELHITTDAALFVDVAVYGYEW